MKRIVLLISFLLSACTTPHKVENIDTKLDKESTLRESEIGINDKKQAVIQTIVAPEVELDRQIWTNNDLEQKVGNEHSQLKTCRNDLSDPRLGGDGKLVPLPDVDDMVQAEMTEQKVGLDEKGKLKVVKKEIYVERLEREQKKSVVLSSLLRTIRHQREDCEHDLSLARAKHTRNTQ